MSDFPVPIAAADRPRVPLSSGADIAPLLVVVNWGS